MVAHLLRLKARLLANGFRRSPWQLVGVIIGGLYGLFVTAMLLVGLFYLGGQGADTVGTALVLAVSATVLGWALIPVVFTGVDLTLDPARFTTFTIPPRQLVTGLLLSGFIGVPGVVTLLLLAGQGLAWRASPAAAVAAVACGVLAAVLCLAVARLTSAAATALTGSRRFREIAAMLLIVPLVLLGPIVSSATAGIESAMAWLPAAADALGWTPLGSFAAVPADVAAGAWATAAVRFALSVAYLAGVLRLWKASLLRALETPPRESGGGKGAEGVGALRLFPATPWGAVAGRALTYWLRDPRYAVSIIVVPLLPVLAVYWSAQSGNFSLLLYLAPVLAILLSFSISADVSYDSTAFALHVVSGLRGVDDRLGRVVACAVISVPVVLVAAVLPPLLLGQTEMLPAVLGVSIGALLSGFGVSSVASARFTYAVPQPGDSPFKTPPGAGVRMMVVQVATMLVMTVLLLPAGALLVAQLVTGDAVYGWWALVVGPLVGAVLFGIGLRLGGRWWDARLPELMQATVLNR
ncbi:MAG: transporter [Arthrobacter sp.]|uniref:transporter n=1 Tax=Arthrobacter sp. TaxID=1667 RepID=UPI0034894451